MGFLGWMAVCGALLLVVALSSAFLRNLPVSTSILYLGVGVAVGPVGFGWLQLDVREAAPWLERLTEIAVIVSLFIGGLKLRAPLRAAPWRAPVLLAGPVMLASIAGVALLAHFALGLGIAAALLLGATLAPTDPVLAGAVAVSNASDRDRMRYGLSGEAGLNDGTAFPFVVLALLWAEHGGGGDWLFRWAAHRLLWAVPAALAIGYFAGLGVGRFAITLRHRQRDDSAPNDFLALALIALSYVVSDLVGAWGFLAAFAAGLGLRRAELKVVHDNPHPDARPLPRKTEDDGDGGALHVPAEDLVPGAKDEQKLDQPAVAAGVLVAETLSFGATAERLLEVTLIVMVGACLVPHWDARAVPLALVLFFVIRPLSVWLFLAGSPTSRRQRLLMGWFGIRGIGSLYYLTYALRESHDRGEVIGIVNLTVSVVALSVLIHGVSSRPLLLRYEQSLQRAKSSPASGVEASA
jgi:NhaP-type Na+/H+ or K+/H+ antiporter